MEINKIRETLSDLVANHHDFWLEALQDTSPAHYGINDWDVCVYPKDIWVDIPNRSFKFKNATFTFDIRLGESGEDGADSNFEEQVSGYGIFDFLPNEDIQINELFLDNTTIELF